jgi:hypothetical protein
MKTTTVIEGAIAWTIIATTAVLRGVHPTAAMPRPGLLNRNWRNEDRHTSIEIISLLTF